MVSGPAARAIGDLARERWESGNGERLEPIEDVEECWPEGVEPLFTDVDVAISRTSPEHNGSDLVHEIELLWLAAIAAAKRFVYIESQYFANRRIAEAMADRLREDDGPEFVVVNPETAQGWLSEKAMGVARAKLLAFLREADVHGRFRLYVPVTEARRPIYVHAKVMVLDDRLLRIGSSNLNNRSMGLDTECDLSIEAVAGSPRQEEIAATIVGFRDRLLGEHLGVPPDEVAAVVAETGSLVQADRAAAPPDGPVAGGVRAAGPRAGRPEAGRQRAARPGEDAEPLASGPAVLRPPAPQSAPTRPRTPGARRPLSRGAASRPAPPCGRTVGGRSDGGGDPCGAASAPGWGPSSRWPPSPG